MDGESEVTSVGSFLSTDQSEWIIQFTQNEARVVIQEIVI